MKNKECSIIHSYSRARLKSSQYYNQIGGAGMVEWHLPPPVRPGFAISVHFRQFYFSIKPGPRNWKILLKPPF